MNKRFLGVIALLAVASWGTDAIAAIRVTGCVKDPMTLEQTDIALFHQHTRIVKLFFPDGTYRGTTDIAGAGLREILEKADITKKSDDGFDRPLDTYILVKGRGGERALFSYGEIFLSDDQDQFLLADRMRPVIPHHHANPTELGWDREAWLDSSAREKLEMKKCMGCHDGHQQVKLSLPAGMCLVPTHDKNTHRFIADVAEISVCQAGVTVSKSDSKDKSLWVDRPVLVLKDGHEVPIGPDSLNGLPTIEWQDASVGMGRGFQGIRQWKGASLLGLLNRNVGANPDYGTFAILVTASDGYRCLYSGGEMAYSPLGETLILADTVDGKPMDKDSGRFRTVTKEDFFIDRSVRLVKEIRILPIQ